jgi:hypothetical protein
MHKRSAAWHRTQAAETMQKVGELEAEYKRLGITLEIETPKSEAEDTHGSTRTTDNYRSA